MVSRAKLNARGPGNESHWGQSSEGICEYLLSLNLSYVIVVIKVKILRMTESVR